MRYFLFFFFLIFNSACLLAQPATPFLRIEDGMHTDPITSISTDTAGNMLLTCSLDKTARLWDASNGQVINILRVPIASDDEGKLYAGALSPDGTSAVLGGQTGEEWDGTFCAYIVDTQTGKIIHRITGLPGGVLDLKFSRDGKQLAVALSAGGVHIYNVKDWSLVKALTDYAAAVPCIAFDKNGCLATASYDGKIVLYNKTFEKVAEAKNLVSTHPGCLAFNPVDTLLAVGYDDVPGIEIRGAASLTKLYQPSINIKNANNLIYRPVKIAFSADGDKLYAGGSYQEMDVRNDWKCIIRQWVEKGKGPHLDFDAMDQNIDGIQPLPKGQLAVIGAYPEICVLTARGERLWRYAAAKNMYNYKSRENPALTVDSSGAIINFTPYSRKALGFNAVMRRVSATQYSGAGPVRSNGGTSFSTGKNGSPLVNEQPLHLDSGETIDGEDVSTDGKEVVVSTSFHIYKVDAKGTTVWKTPLQANAFAVKISGNNKTVIAELGDGTIRWYRMTDGKELLAFYLRGTEAESHQRTWVLFTPSGYYDASAGGEDILGWHINNDPDKAPSFYSVSIFRSQYYRPDVIDALFQTYDEDKAVDLANAKSKRPARTAFDITERRPPQIVIETPLNGSTTNTGVVTIKYSVVTPVNAPVTRLRILINGRPAAWQNQQRGVIVQATNDYTVDVQIPAQDCTVTLLGDNDYGISPATTVSLKYKATTPLAGAVQLKPTLYILAVGISNYKNPDLKLHYGAADATAFAAAMEKFKGISYADVVVKRLVDSSATKDNIEDAFDWIDKYTTPQDVAMIFYAGHGISDRTGDFYMLPYGADVEKLKKTGVSADELRGTVRGILGKVIVFIDACNSGNAIGSGGLLDVADMTGELNKLRDAANGAYAFTGCQTKEVAFEKSDWQHGAFTKALLEAMVDGACLKSGQKDITPTNLADYLVDRVPALTENRQHSTYVSPPNSGNFSIAKL